MRLSSTPCRLARPADSWRPVLGRTSIATRSFSHTRLRLADSKDPKDPDAEAKEQEASRLKKSNPLLARWYEAKEQEKQAATGEDAPQYDDAAVSERLNNLGSKSIFDAEDGAAVSGVDPVAPGKFIEQDPATLDKVFNPMRDSRVAWEKRMIRQTVKRRGRLTKDELVARTERQSLTKSHWLKTSVKKLGPLARQIAGKPIEDAILQMRFSKKKAAQDVRSLLELARDEAIVRRGMGLGKAEHRMGTPIEIELKDGSKRAVADRTGIYVDQAWVGRGSYKLEPEFRARGRVNYLRHPHTSISVLLKEQATLVREAAERQKKKENKKVWVQLPDRPVTKQHQYCLW